jgi:HD superfamily phosphohydrolase
MKPISSENLSLLPAAIDDPETISFWINAIHNDEVLSLIVRSKAFLRLRDISFLGALDYTYPGIERIGKFSRSRADHSLHVAALAAYVSAKRNYSAELTRHLIVAALLHDIGHAPLSHSAEPFIKSKIGYGHHEAGEQIIEGRQAIGKELHGILNKYVSVEFIIKLLNMDVVKEDGGDLFYSPINIDTIDGIIRSHSYFTGFSSAHSKLAVAYASFVSDDNLKHNILDSFWAMKERVYSGLINDDIGLVSDRTSELFFHDFSIPFEESDLYSVEKSWQQKHKKLFSQLNKILKDKVMPGWFSDTTLSFVHRQYYVIPDRDDIGRYSCKKVKKTKKIELREEAAEELNNQQLFNFKRIFL